MSVRVGGHRLGRVARILQAVGTLLALGILTWTARSSWAELSHDPVSIAFTSVGISVVALSLSYLWFVALWGELVRTLGANIRYSAALELWAVSNLSRYLPGKVWGIAAVAAASGRAGLSPGLGATAAVLALAISIGSGALVGLILIPDVVRRLGVGGYLTAALALGLLAPIAAPRLLSLSLAALPSYFQCTGVAPLARVRLLRLVAMFCAGWAGHGVAFWLFAGAFGPVGFADVGRMAGSYALAHVAGLMAIFAPGGIGVREGVLSELLSLAGFDELPVHTLSVATRLWVIAAELLVLIAALAVRIRGRAPA